MSPVQVSAKERTLLIERFNRTVQTIKSTDGELSQRDAITAMYMVMADAMAVIGTLVDIVGNTKGRPGE